MTVPGPSVAEGRHRLASGRDRGWMLEEVPELRVMPQESFDLAAKSIIVPHRRSR